MTSPRRPAPVSPGVDDSTCRRWATALALVTGVGLLSGCGGLQRQNTGLPSRHKVTANQLIVQSDVRLPRQHPLMKDLEELRQEIARTLELPIQTQPVTVYLFADQVRYAQYLQTAFPNLPPRRAYFVGTPEELAVYTFWGEKIQEDLRHEYTHGILHACLKTVPLWLDEGLAEYFEVSEPPRGYNREYAEHLSEALRNGWKADMTRLEQLADVSQMQKGDYLESWAWVHFMLHDSDDSRAVLLDYLKELRLKPEPESLTSRLARTLPNVNDRFLAHAMTLGEGTIAAAKWDDK